MATRISYQFVTFYNETYRVDIDDADFVGDALDVDVAPDGFTLRYDGQTDSVNPGIVGSSCSVSILVTPDNAADMESFAADLISSVETRFTIAIYKITAGPTTSLYWAGYVLKDLGRIEDTGSTYFYAIKSVDGLARLKNVDYKDDSVLPAIPIATDEFIDHILRILNEIGTSALYWDNTDIFLRTVVNWQDGNMPAATAAKDPLKYSRVAGEVFAKKARSSDGDDWDWKSMYSAIEEICENWGARLMLSNGAWRFEQVRERMEENFFERRWSNNNTLLSSTNSAGYDKAIIQVGDDNRLSGGQFGYLPPLSKVEVLYDHKTYKNHLENLSWKWYNGSASNSAITRSGFTFDADTYFNVKGTLKVNVSVVSYTKPWRYIFGIILRTNPGNYRIDSETTPIVVGGVGIPTLNRESPNWQVASVYYEVSTPWIYSTNFVGEIPFAFSTPFVPSGQTGFTVDFNSGLGGEDYAANSVSVTVNDWRWKDLVLQIYGNDSAGNFEVARRYLVNNVNTGNSDALKIETAFGHAVYGWTACKIETTDDDTFVDWDDTTATWERANENTAAEFGQLLAYQTMQLQATTVETYSGTLSADSLHAHSRIVFPDDSTWLINHGEFQAKPNLWDVEMFKTGVADGADIDIDTPIGVPGHEDIPGVNTPGIAVAPGSGTGTMSASGFDGKLALAILTGNTVSTHISAGTVTSIPVDEPVKANSLFDGDLVYVVDPQSGQTFTFVVDGNQSGGATSIAVDSTSIPNAIPIGAQVIPSPLNIYTTSGGGGSWGGAGDINNGGNTTGATVVIGTNDANALQFETNNVARVNITGGASTGGAVTITDVTANTTTVEDVLSLIANSTGTAAAGLGPGIAMYAESSTTDSTFAGRIWAAWLTATHASRKSKIGFQTSYNGSAVEVASLDATNSGKGRLLVGATFPVALSSAGIDPAVDFALTLLSGKIFRVKYSNGNDAINVEDSAVGAYLMSRAGNAFLYADDTGATIERQSGGQIYISTTIMQVTDSKATKRGLEYAADYSATYNTRSLVDKGYVTGLLSSYTTGSGTANYIAYWSSGSALTGEAALYYDPTNDRVGINQSSPQKRLSIVTSSSLDGIRIESDGTLDQDPGRIELMGTATGPYVQRGFIALDVYSNAGALPDGQALYFQLQRDSGTLYTAMALYNNQAIFNNASGFNIANNSGRLRFQSSSAGIFNTDNNWLLTTSAQTTNDANSRLKIVSIGTTSSNYGLRVYNSTPTLIFAVRDDQHVGVNVDPADAIVQLKGLGTTTAKTLLVENSSGTDNFYVQDSGLVSGVAYQSVSAAPTVTYGAAAGTGPTTVLISGAQNGVNIFFTTGTSPSASTTVMTVNLPKSFANGCAASWLAYNAATQPIIGNFWLSGTSQNSITIAYAGTLAASTDYALSITIMGF